jgi:hypothetical protein
VSRAPKYKSKRQLSAHQKQLRFFTVLFVVLILVGVAGLLWLMNGSGLGPH